MKNMLTIKRLSSVLLVGMMAVASSAMGARADYPEEGEETEFTYTARKTDTGENKVITDWPGRNTSIGDAVCPEDRWKNFAYGGKKIDGSTPIWRVPANGGNMVVAYGGGESADAAWKATKAARTPHEITANFYNTKTGKGFSRKLNIFGSYEVRTFFDNFDYDNEYQVIMGNGQRVNDSATFEDIMNQNGNNEFTVFDTDNSNLLPTSSRRNRK